MNRKIFLLAVLIISVIQLTCNINGFAQQLYFSPSDTIQIDQNKYTIRFHTGTTVSIMGGEWTKEQQNILLNSDTTYMSYSQFSPSIGFYFGGTFDYSVNQNFSIGVGLSVLQRRFQQHSQYNYYHPVSLYDEELTNKISYQTTYLNVPLQAKLSSLKRIKPYIGIGTGLLLSS
ncbi:outer membrane beta-barrel protein, partial [uncultured Cyclobacterium sp.]|uniref:outer membrane beta-barrel protein n=1 Tax=uncultured Cyclobacterium sp. TaxID=453820 RepID=UPI0030EED801